MGNRPWNLFIYEVRLCVAVAPEFESLPGVKALKTEDGPLAVLIQPEVKADGREFEWHRVSLSFEPDHAFDPRADRSKRLAFRRACTVAWRAHEKRMYHEYRDRLVASQETGEFGRVVEPVRLPSFDRWRLQHQDVLDDERTNFMSAGVRFKEVRTIPAPAKAGRR